MAQELKNTLGKTFLKLSFQSDTQLVYAQWVNKASLAELKKGIFLITEFIQQNQAKYLIDDRQRFESPFIELNDWWVLEWYPQIQALGLHTIAIVAPENLLGKLSIKDLNHKIIELRPQIEIFASFLQAYQWITQQQYAIAK
ncbi:MAG: hypothetical protein NZ551_06540 [Microscillaceae bacterium]|nr:hypothetical protein [Microscillaceae bacterium]MDW8460851.1 hypothetical protein [Cytophagales bacterium]